MKSPFRRAQAGSIMPRAALAAALLVGAITVVPRPAAPAILASSSYLPAPTTTTATATNTPLPGTATSTASVVAPQSSTPTATLPDTATPSSTPTNTATIVPTGTASSTPVPSATATASSTPVPDTATSSATPTVTQSGTPTSTTTVTASSTPEPSVTATASSTASTATATLPTGTLTPTNLPNCQLLVLPNPERIEQGGSEAVLFKVLPGTAITGTILGGTYPLTATAYLNGPDSPGTTVNGTPVSGGYRYALTGGADGRALIDFPIPTTAPPGKVMVQAAATESCHQNYGSLTHSAAFTVEPAQASSFSLVLSQSLHDGQIHSVTGKVTDRVSVNTAPGATVSISVTLGGPITGLRDGHYPGDMLSTATATANARGHATFHIVIPAEVILPGEAEMFQETVTSTAGSTSRTDRTSFTVGETGLRLLIQPQETTRGNKRPVFQVDNTRPRGTSTLSVLVIANPGALIHGTVSLPPHDAYIGGIVTATNDGSAAGPGGRLKLRFAIPNTAAPSQGHGSALVVVTSSYPANSTRNSTIGRGETVAFGPKEKAPAPAQPAGKPSAVIVLGDSVASGHHDGVCDDYQYAYGQYVFDQLTAKPATGPWTYDNFAHSGYSTSQVISGGLNACNKANGRRPLAQAIQVLKEFQGGTNVVLISAAVNNTNWVSIVKKVGTANTRGKQWVLGNISQADCQSIVNGWDGAKNKNQITGDVKNIIAQLVAADAKVHIYWNGYYGIAKTGTSWVTLVPESCDMPITNALNQLQGYIKDGINNDSHVTFVDIDAILHNKQPLLQYYNKDANPIGYPHPNKDGHSAIADAIIKLITAQGFL